MKLLQIRIHLEIMYLFLLFCLLPFARGHDVNGAKYMLIYDSPIFALGDESAEFIDPSKVQVERVNETTAIMSGEMNFLKEIGVNHILELKLLKKVSSDSYEPVFSHNICNICEEMTNKDSKMKKFVSDFGFPDKCPIEAGSYTINNLAIATDQMDLSSQHEGSYLATLNVHEKTGDTCQDRKLKCTLQMHWMVEESDNS